MKKQQFEEFVTLFYVIIFCLSYIADITVMYWVFAIFAILNLIYQLTLAVKSNLKKRIKEKEGAKECEHPYHSVTGDLDTCLKCGKNLNVD